MNPLKEFALLKLGRGGSVQATDLVIEERPIAMVYNGVHHALMMATPSDLIDFAYGFSLTEGLIDGAADLKVLEIVERSDGAIIEMALSDPHFARLAARRRSLLGSSGCGICGSEALAGLPAPADVGQIGLRVDSADIRRAFQALARAQILNRQSGGVHAAAWIHSARMTVREDVGRHNALDKLIGDQMRQTRSEGFLLLSSRLSYELVYKAAVAKIAVVAAISAPTALAIETAKRCGITLIGFARDEQMNVYCGAERVDAALNPSDRL